MNWRRDAYWFSPLRKTGSVNLLTYYYSYRITYVRIPYYHKNRGLPLIIFMYHDLTPFISISLKNECAVFTKHFLRTRTDRDKPTPPYPDSHPVPAKQNEKSLNYKAPYGDFTFDVLYICESLWCMCDLRLFMVHVQYRFKTCPI